MHRRLRAGGNDGTQAVAGAGDSIYQFLVTTTIQQSGQNVSPRNCNQTGKHQRVEHKRSANAKMVHRVGLA